MMIKIKKNHPSIFNSLFIGRAYCLEGIWTITSYCPEGVRTTTSYCPEPLSNVRAGWPCLYLAFLTLFPSQQRWPLTKVPSLQTTGSPQGTGFPRTSGQNSGTFGPSLRVAFRGLGNFFET